MATKGGGPEWISQTISDATLLTEDGPRRCQIATGLIRLPDGSGQRIAGQMIGEDRVFILSPRSAAEIIGALRQGLLA
jgi:hypothetical protein